MSPYAGLAGLMLRWRYADADAEAFDWYAQVDDAGLLCDRGTCDTPPITGGIADDSFESGAAWTVASSNFATPLCTEAACGIDAGRTGTGWVFFGGAGNGTAEVASVEQSVVLEPGLAILSFYLWVPQASGNGTDTLRLLVDGQEVFAAAEGDLRFRPGYRRIDVDLSAQADGGSHLLRFEATTSGSPSHTNFMLDDVGLEICTSVVADPDISIGKAEVTEGNSGTVDANFTVTLSAASQFTIEVDYATSDISATGGATGDYLPASGTLTLPAGTRSANFAVQVRGDTVDEPDETFLVTLSNPTRGILSRAQDTGIIRNDDAAFLSITDSAALERDTATSQAVFTVSLSSPSSQSVIVDYTTSPGTATAGADFMSAAGSLSFPPGATSRQITIEVSGDVKVERDETFFVDLRNPSNAGIFTERGTGKIIDNDRGRFPVEGTDVLYTESVDFDQGRLLNVNTDVPDQLQLDRNKTTFPNIWGRGLLPRHDRQSGHSHRHHSG